MSASHAYETAVRKAVNETYAVRAEILTRDALKRWERTMTQAIAERRSFGQPARG